RFGFAQAGTGDLLPGGLGVAREPGWIRQEVSRGQAARGELDDALGAKDLQTEARTGALVFGPVGGEIARNFLRKTVQRIDLITSEGPDALPAFAHFSLGEWFARLVDTGKTPLRIAGKQAHQVHDVRAEHHQVFAAAASIF